MNLDVFGGDAYQAAGDIHVIRESAEAHPENLIEDMVFEIAATLHSIRNNIILGSIGCMTGAACSCHVFSSHSELIGRPDAWLALSVIGLSLSIITVLASLADGITNATQLRLIVNLHAHMTCTPNIETIYYAVKATRKHNLSSFIGFCSRAKKS